jgi:hypothetical protein
MWQALVMGRAENVDVVIADVVRGHDKSLCALAKGPVAERRAQAGLEPTRRKT